MNTVIPHPAGVDGPVAIVSGGGALPFATADAAIGAAGAPRHRYRGRAPARPRRPARRAAPARRPHRADAAPGRARAGRLRRRPDRRQRRGGDRPGRPLHRSRLLGADAELPTICAVNKIDRLGPNELVPVLAEAAELGASTRSSRSAPAPARGSTPLVERLGELVPEGPYMYPPEDHSDQSSELLLAELIREQVLNRTREEIPHSVEVKVGEIAPRGRPGHRPAPRSGPRPSRRRGS